MTAKLALVLLLLVIGLGIVIYVGAILLEPDEPTFTPTVTLAPTATDTLTPPSMWTPIPATTHPSTLIPTPGEQVVIKIDGVEVNDVWEVNCNSSPRIEVEVLDHTGDQLQANGFSYTWHFNPRHGSNRDMVESKNYAIIYSVPCDQTDQTVTIEVLKDGKTRGVRSIRFIISQQP